MKDLNTHKRGCRFRIRNTPEYAQILDPSCPRCKVRMDTGEWPIPSALGVGGTP